MDIKEILNIKNDSIPVILAPMAGVTDLAFREICMGNGCDFTYSEMVSAKAISYNNKKTYRLMSFTERAKPFGIQLFGHDPIIMGDMAQRICDIFGDDLSLIDINMGCPAPKIVNNGDGSALMKTPLLAGSIIESVVKKSSVPVTVKFRKGFDNNNINALEFALIAENSGAFAVTVHGRTREQMYSSNADWDIIAQIKQLLKIPVIGNGDVISGEAAVSMLKKTGCDAIMIGRGARGNPFIFEEVKCALKGYPFEKPSCKKRIETAIYHAKLHEKYKTEASFSEMRKHIAWYTSGIKGSAQLRSRIFSCNSIQEAESILKDMLLFTSDD